MLWSLLYLAKELRLEKDSRGVPHLVGVYEHWRPHAGKQNEEQFSDGTLRLLGLLWALQEGDGPLLLEEPELSLHSGVVRRLAGLIYRLQKDRKRQVMISTHSTDLLSDPGIGGEEVLLLKPDVEGTRVVRAESDREIRHLLESGMSVADAVFPHTEPQQDCSIGSIFAMTPIYVSLAAEGLLDEQVLRRLLTHTGRDYVPTVCYGKRGKDHLRQNIARFNHAAEYTPYVILTDLDNDDCAPQLIDRWLPQGRHSNLTLRIAVREVEAWLLADRERFARFLGVAESKIPLLPDEVRDPKLLVVNLARQSRKRAVREDLVPVSGGTSQVRKNYVGHPVSSFRKSGQSTLTFDVTRSA